MYYECKVLRQLLCKSMPSGQDSSCSVPVTGAAHIYHSGYSPNIYLFSKQQNSHRWLESLTSTSGGGGGDRGWGSVTGSTIPSLQLEFISFNIDTPFHCGATPSAFTEYGVIGKIFVDKKYLVTPLVFKLQKWFLHPNEVEFNQNQTKTKLWPRVG